MNLLPFVISLLIMLSALTYSQLQNFLLRERLNGEIVYYLKTRNQYTLNYWEQQVYDDKHGTAEETQKTNDRVDALSKINLKELQNSEPHRLLLKKVIDEIYKGRLFYQKALEERPELLDNLIAALEEQLQQWGQNNKRQIKVTDIANFELNDPLLNTVLAEMLSDIPTPESLRKEQQKLEYYPNIINYVTFSGATGKGIRIFLAPKPLIMAIFEDAKTVNDIIEMRHQIYLEMKNSDASIRPSVKAKTSSDFRQHFETQIPSIYPKTLFNFETSTTLPEDD